MLNWEEEHIENTAPRQPAPLLTEPIAAVAAVIAIRGESLGG